MDPRGSSSNVKPSLKIREWFHRVFRNSPKAREIPSPGFVKAQLPRAAFTRSGPGVRDALHRVLRQLSLEQREIAIDRGWEKGSMTRDDWRLHRAQQRRRDEKK